MKVISSAAFLSIDDVRLSLYYGKAFIGIHIIWIFRAVNIDETTQRKCKASLKTEKNHYSFCVKEFLNSYNREQLKADRDILVSRQRQGRFRFQHFIKGDQACLTNIRRRSASCNLFWRLAYYFISPSLISARWSHNIQ